MSNNSELIIALTVIAEVLEAPQSRFGKLEFYTEEARNAREELRDLAQRYDVGPSHTILDQAAKVARAAIAKSTGR